MASLTSRIAALQRTIHQAAAARRKPDVASIAVKFVQLVNKCSAGGVLTQDELNFMPRWWHPQIKTIDKQQALWNSTCRFNVVPAGRRSGKTDFAKRNLIRRAVAPQRYEDAWYVFAAPTVGQAKRIYWKHLKAAIPAILRDGKPNESEMNIHLWNGADITVLGLDVPERAEGKPLSGIVLDEYGNMKPQAWKENVRPSLSDRGGWAWMIGVPEGRNHYYDLYKRAVANDHKTWGAFTWTSEEVLPQEEIDEAKQDLDELTYNQEYRAQFVTFGGLIYYTFAEANISQKQLPYRDESELLIMFDFNVEPGVAAIGQESGNDCTHIIGEIYIPQNSNTVRICNKIIEQWGKHKGLVTCYGDATGGNRGTAKISGSDWDLIKQYLKPVFGDRLRFRVKTKNPEERSRVNAVNSRVCSVTGQRRVMVDARCLNIIKDFEGVRVLEGSAGEIDKDSDPALTHLTDAIGYYIEYKYPIGKGVAVSQNV